MCKCCDKGSQSHPCQVATVSHSRLARLDCKNRLNKLKFVLQMLRDMRVRCKQQHVWDGAVQKQMQLISIR